MDALASPKNTESKAQGSPCMQQALPGHFVLLFCGCRTVQAHGSATWLSAASLPSEVRLSLVSKGDLHFLLHSWALWLLAGSAPAACLSAWALLQDAFLMCPSPAPAPVWSLLVLRVCFGFHSFPLLLQPPDFCGFSLFFFFFLTVGAGVAMHFPLSAALAVAGALYCSQANTSGLGYFF